MTSWNDMVIAGFRAGDATIAGRFDRGRLLLLHTTGARTGEPRTAPLAYFPLDDGRLVIVGSAAGADQHPAWYFNVLADPHVTVERWEGDEQVSFPAVATVTEGAERDELWARTIGAAPGFADYQRKTDRVLPVITLQRA
jgi:deazaflavin-dependent oxidoreductase (nitroreductase family)